MYMQTVTTLLSNVNGKNIEEHVQYYALSNFFCSGYFYAFCMMIVKRTYLFMQKWFYDESNFQQMDVSLIRRSRCFHVKYACKFIEFTFSLGWGLWTMASILFHASSSIIEWLSDVKALENILLIYMSSNCFRWVTSWALSYQNAIFNSFLRSAALTQHYHYYRSP